MFTFRRGEANGPRWMLLIGTFTLASVLTACGGSSSSGSTGTPPDPDPEQEPELTLVITEDNAHRLAFAAISSYFMTNTVPDNALGSLTSLLEDDTCPENTIETDGDTVTHTFNNCEDEGGVQYTGSIVVQQQPTTPPNALPMESLIVMDGFSMHLHEVLGPDMFFSYTLHGDGQLHLEERNDAPYEGTLSTQALRYGMAYEMAMPPVMEEADAVEVLLHDLTIEFEGYYNEPHTTLTNGFLALVSEEGAAYALQETDSPLHFNSELCPINGTTTLYGADDTWMSIHASVEDEVIVTVSGHALPPMNCDELNEWFDVPGGNA